MEINRLKEFLSLAETLNFSETAQTFFLTQPVLSRHIASLESELGVKLFYRTPRSVTLTEFGENFHPYAKEIVKTYGKALKSLNDISDMQSGSLKIDSCFEIFGSDLQEFIYDFSQLYPDIKVNCHDTLNTQITEMLKDFHTDLVITFQLEDISHEEYNTITIFEENLCFVTRKEHPLATKDSVSISELNGERLIEIKGTQGQQLHPFTQELFSKNGLSYLPSGRAETVRSGYSMVEMGFGNLISPYNETGFRLNQAVAIPIEKPYGSLKFVVTWRKDNPNPNINPFIQFLKEKLVME